MLPFSNWSTCGLHFVNDRSVLMSVILCDDGCAVVTVISSVGCVGRESMDEHLAALALTSLSTSPASPILHSTIGKFLRVHIVHISACSILDILGATTTGTGGEVPQTFGLGGTSNLLVPLNFLVNLNFLRRL